MEKYHWVDVSEPHIKILKLYVLSDLNLFNPKQSLALLQRSVAEDFYLINRI